MRVLVSGSTGFIGTALGLHLTANGHKVLPLVRKEPDPGEVWWDPVEGSIRLDAFRRPGACFGQSADREGLREGALRLRHRGGRSRTARPLHRAKHLLIDTTVA